MLFNATAQQKFDFFCAVASWCTSILTPSIKCLPGLVQVITLLPHLEEEEEEQQSHLLVNGLMLMVGRLLVRGTGVLRSSSSRKILPVIAGLLLVVVEVEVPIAAGTKRLLPSQRSPVMEIAPLAARQRRRLNAIT